MNEMDYAFRRTYERKRYRAEIVFAHKKHAYTGIIRNISLGGAFVATKNVNQVHAGDLVALTIPFTDGGKHVKRQARIKWMNEEGFAVEFL